LLFEIDQTCSAKELNQNQHTEELERLQEQDLEEYNCLVKGHMFQMAT